MSKVTYLFGAGASANALPTIKGIQSDSDTKLSKRMLSIAEQLTDLAVKENYKDINQELAERLQILSQKSEEFQTIDTYAKYLYLKGDTKRTEYDSLKRDLALFFMIEQSINKKFDKRYLIFLTNILREGYTFPTDVKIINWNYDFQMQLACQYFKEESQSLFDGGVKHTPGLMDYFPPLGKSDVGADELDMVHLNGIAGVYYNQDRKINTTALFSKEDKMNALYDSLSIEYDAKQVLLTFAWEDQPPVKELGRSIEYACGIAEGTNYLVIIGYSFPFYNREIDKQLFKVLNSETLVKIFYQDPKLDGKFLKAQFGLRENIEIVHWPDTENFYVPKEL